MHVQSWVATSAGAPLYSAVFCYLTPLLPCSTTLSVNSIVFPPSTPLPCSTTLPGNSTGIPHSTTLPRFHSNQATSLSTMQHARLCAKFSAMFYSTFPCHNTNRSHRFVHEQLATKSSFSLQQRALYNIKIHAFNRVYATTSYVTALCSYPSLIAGEVLQQLRFMFLCSKVTCSFT